MRFTMPDLMADQARIDEGMKPMFAEADALIVEVAQPDDPFDGMGDFEVHPLAFELMRERDISRMLLAQVAAAQVGLANIEAILDRPLSKLKVKDLKVLIGAAQDALAAAKEQME